MRLFLNKEVPVEYSVIIPVFNESKSLCELLERISSVFQLMNKKGQFEIIFVDDGSTDDSRQILREFSQAKSYVRSIFLRKNFGKSFALTAGFIRSTGSYIITLDGDLQDRPEEIPKMISKINEGYDLVTGWRERRRDSFLKRWGSWWFNLVVSWCGGIRLHDSNCGFKVYKANVAKTIAVYGQQYRFIPLLAHFSGFKVAEVIIDHDSRKYGNSRYPTIRYQSFFDLLSILFIYRFRFSPLYFFGIIGGLLVVPSTLVILYLGGCQIFYLVGLGEHFNVLTQNRPIFAVSLTMCLIGIQIFLTGLVCEYLLYHQWDRRVVNLMESFVEEIVE